LRAVASRCTDLGVRSEHILLDAPGTGVPATVQVVQPLEPSTVVTAAWDGGTLTARVPGIAALPPGETVGLHLDPAGLLFFDRETGLKLEA
jgi:multiple sugar transport system ATP-binding protein